MQITKVKACWSLTITKKLKFLTKQIKTILKCVSDPLNEISGLFNLNVQTVTLAFVLQSTNQSKDYGTVQIRKSNMRRTNK